MSQRPILVTGAAGKVGSVGFKIVGMLRAKGLPVRALVRQMDHRADALIQLGAEIVVGDLTSLADLNRVIAGCSKIYFGMSVSDSYLEATLSTAAVAKQHNVEVFVNISQMTVSQMNIFDTVSRHSKQQKYHWLAEQVLNWSGLPVVHLRSTIFLEHPFFTQFAAHSISQSGEIRLPFGRNTKTSPIATVDVARVATVILAEPEPHIGKVYELTGGRSEDMNEIASHFAAALHKDIKYVDVPQLEWEQTDLLHEKQSMNSPPHMINHLITMAKLHHSNNYDRLTNNVEKITGVKPMTVEGWVANNLELFHPTQAT